VTAIQRVRVRSVITTGLERKMYFKSHTQTWNRELLLEWIPDGFAELCDCPDVTLSTSSRSKPFCGDGLELTGNLQLGKKGQGTAG